MTEWTDITNFWFGLSHEKHFVADPELDAEITQKFAAAHLSARNGELDHWLNEPETSLALIILLDQFARNIHRGTPDMFSADEKARQLTKSAIVKGHDMALDAEKRIWFYLPLQHSEDLEDQRLSMRLTEKSCTKETIQYAKVHHDIIERFGRFPHRNDILNRQTTKEEQFFLDEGGFAG